MRSLSGIVLLVSVSSFGQVVLEDPLSGSTTGTQAGGAFVAGGGWQAPRQVKWDLGAALTEGTFSVQLSNWNPNSDSPQHRYDKQHILAMYEAPHGSPHDSDGDSPKTSFWQVRTGAGYDNCFKFLSSTSGFDPPPAGRIENRVRKALGTIQPSQTYTLEVRWTRSGEVTVLLDGQVQETHQHGRPLRLRYVFVGTDNAPSGTYGPQHDVVYRNVRVTGTSATPPDAGVSSPPDAGPAPADGGWTLSFSPVADSWTDPANPGTTHGADPDLRAGGDGRVIYLRFDVRGVGRVQRARLLLQAMNAGGGGDLRSVTDTTWTEASLSHQNRPAVGATPVASLGRVEIGGTYGFDVTQAITGNGPHSFAVTSTDPDGCGYHSRETAATRPELVIESVAGAGGGTGGGGAAGGAGGSGAGGGAGGGTGGPGGGAAGGAGGGAGGGTGGGAAGGAAGGAGGGAAGGSVGGGGGSAGGEAAGGAGEADQLSAVQGGCSAAAGAAPLLGALVVWCAARRRRGW